LLPSSGESEIDLIVRCQQGDDRAFAELYRRHAPALFVLACRILHNCSEAEDALQNTFVKLHGSLGSFRREAKLDTFLHRILINCCRDQLRRRKPAEPFENFPEPSGMLDWENRFGLQEAIARLPERMGIAFILFAVEEWPMEEIASAMGISRGGAKATVFQARRRLRLWLAEQK
jgi:RNA polymerase sigma-70 factor, ECF subfamily